MAKFCGGSDTSGRGTGSATIQTGYTCRQLHTKSHLRSPDADASCRPCKTRRREKRRRMQKSGKGQMRGAATQAMPQRIFEERQRSRCPLSATPRRAAARKAAGFVARSLHTAAGILALASVPATLSPVIPAAGRDARRGPPPHKLIFLSQVRTPALPITLKEAWIILRFSS